ncbi:MAG: hypothetical protein AAF587_30295 [Bacteroidota bacterium]
MDTTTEQCFKCQGKRGQVSKHIYGYPMCEICYSKLGLLSDTTIKKHALSHEDTRGYDPLHPSFEDEINRRLEAVEKSYINTRIKLLHILERLNHM